MSQPHARLMIRFSRWIPRSVLPGTFPLALLRRCGVPGGAVVGGFWVALVLTHSGASVAHAVEGTAAAEEAAGDRLIQPDAVSQEARVAGYVDRDEKTFFVFDSSHYHVDPTRVVVTGEFRNWDQDMDSPQWQLHRHPVESTLWTLGIDNPQGHVIGPSVPFKFRIDEGAWMAPSADAPNQAGGNLVHRPDLQPIRLFAEIRSDGQVWARIAGVDATSAPTRDQFRLVNGQDQEVTLDDAQRVGDFEYLFSSASIDRRRVYYLECPDSGIRSLCRRDGWFRELRSDKTLGANVSADGSRTTWRLFAPRADAVRLYLYDQADDREAKQVVELVQDDQGVWETELPGDQHGVFYDFTVHGPVDPGNHFYESHPVHVSDPYARVSVDSFGKCRVWRATQPAAPLAAGRPKMSDVVAYEVHVEDFTAQLPIADELKGTMAAMTIPGLKNEQGEPVGFDHLINLGINVLHLMPVQEYLHYPDEDWKRQFGDDPEMRRYGIDQSNYQWGYRTTHAFAIETRYRTANSPHGSQREQFRDLVQAFHDHDIAVIIDLVPNHTGENMGGRHQLFNFNAIDMPYYYRTDQEIRHIGPFGNEVKTEDRPMVQRWLIDQCRQLISEFGIDGFRIDLAGQIDKETLTRLRRVLGEDIIVYGEPWIAPSDPDVANNPRWSWYKADAPITFFQDDARNALKGPTSDPWDKDLDRGYAGGNASLRESAMLALSNRFEGEAHPNDGINYLDIHDNWALADRFAREQWDGRNGVDEQRFKLAAGMLMTSLGPVVLHGGTELMRSKGSAGRSPYEKQFDGHAVYFKGRGDTYNVRTPNQFVWSNVGKTRQSPGSHHDFDGMLAYWRGLISLRMSGPGQVFRVDQAPGPDHYRWILPQDEHLLGYTVADQVLVLVNTGPLERDFSVDLPAGEWKLVADEHRVDIERGVKGADGALRGARSHTLRVPATSLKIWVRHDGS